MIARRIESRIETSPGGTHVRIGGHRFPGSIHSDAEPRLKDLEDAVVALRSGILELAERVEELERRIGRPEDAF